VTPGEKPAVNKEDRLVERIRALVAPAPGLAIGPGDDAAVIAREGGLLAATTDMLVEGVDFLPDEDPERIGRRAAAVNLSDLAAMGAQPEFFLIAVGFPAERGEEAPLAITRGAVARAADFGGFLAGGDLSAAPLLIVSVAFWGRPAGEPLTRAGARPGDRVYISGQPGEAAAGLRIARRGAGTADSEAERHLLARFRDPTPRIALGAALAREGLATAAIDVSDGLGVDAGRLARSSGARIVLAEERLPVSAALGAFASAGRFDPLALVLEGGDDYELLFTARDADAARLGELARGLEIPVHEIGEVTAGSGAVLAGGGSGAGRDIAELGHDHLETVL
jgi:thiamine-monophosphate kinase